MHAAGFAHHMNTILVDPVMNKPKEQIDLPVDLTSLLLLKPPKLLGYMESVY